MVFMVKITRLFAQTLQFQNLVTVLSVAKYHSSAEGILSSLCNAGVYSCLPTACEVQSCPVSLFSAIMVGPCLGEGTTFFKIDWSTNIP